MRKSDIKVGAIVYFGTLKGPRTRGKITRVNAKSVTVLSLAKRGDAPKESVFRVTPDLLHKTKEANGGRLKPQKRAPLARGPQKRREIKDSEKKLAAAKNKLRSLRR